MGPKNRAGEGEELPAIPLSLWAAEDGYTKLSPNLLGL